MGPYLASPNKYKHAEDYNCDKVSLFSSPFPKTLFPPFSPKPQGNLSLSFCPFPSFDANQYSFESAPAPCKDGETHRKIPTSANTHSLDPTSSFLGFSTAMGETKLLSGFRTTSSRSCRTAVTSNPATISEPLKKHTSR